MFFTSRKKYLTDNAREIQIAGYSNMPQLHRLCSDFGFAVLGLCGRSATPKKYALCEVGLSKCGKKNKAERVSPEFTSLLELEAHVNEYLEEIIQKYLFGEELVDPDVNSVA